ncbi:MAG: hypothetical protein OXU76_03425 [Alphaproteobacteria bacterium]|nr:hypothetical protein [Alphaproteobacteria bacterium]
MIKHFEKIEIASTENGFAIMLDGQALKTQAQTVIHVPTKKMAETLVQEWEKAKQDNMQENIIGAFDTQEIDIQAFDTQAFDAKTLPLTRIVSGAFDLSAHEIDKQAARFVDYGNHDILCYRATHPDMLVERQSEEWDPMIEWCAQTFDISFQQTTKLKPIDQPPETLEKLRALYMDNPNIGQGATDNPAPHLWQNGLSRFATLSNSAILALAVAAGQLDVETAYELSFLDELFQIEQWGVDEDALRRLTILKQEMALLVDYFSLLTSE